MLIPPPPPKKNRPGHPRMDDLKAMYVIFYGARTGCQWNTLPRSLGAKSTVHDRFQEWRDAKGEYTIKASILANTSETILLSSWRNIGLTAISFFMFLILNSAMYLERYPFATLSAFQSSFGNVVAIMYFPSSFCCSISSPLLTE